MAARRGGGERPTTLARPLPSSKVISASTFAFLFSEMISYHRSRTGSIAELETRLEAAGYGIGYRFFELSALRSGKRDLDTISILKFVSGSLWTQLFARQADGLDVAKSTDAGAVGRNEYRIWDNVPVTNMFISLPKEYSRFNPASFIAGIIHGALEGAGFTCSVAAMTASSDGPIDKTVYVIKFDDSVAGREA